MVNTRPTDPRPQAPGGLFHGVDRLDPEYRPRDPANHADRREIEQRILARQPRRPGAVPSIADGRAAPGSVGVIEAALASAPDEPGIEDRRAAILAAYKASGPAAIQIGSRWF